MGIRVLVSVVGVLILAQFNAVAAQKPVITVATSQATLAENPNAITRTTTTTTTVSRLGTANATFTVRSDRVVPSNLTIQYSVSGTAVAGKDYRALSGSVTIPAGQTTAGITVYPIDDSEDEIDETVTISITATLRSPYGTTRPFLARTTILDDDDVRIIGVDLSPDTVLGGETRDMRVTVSGAAPTGGVVVSVTSGNTSVVPAAQTTIAAGTRVGLVHLATAAVPTATIVPLTVREANGSTASATLVVLKEPAVRLVGFRFWDNFGGRRYFGSADIDSPAPPGGWTVPVTLKVVSPAAAALPASAPATITIPAGRTATGLTIDSQPVSVHTQVEVRVGSGSTAAARVIDVYPLPRVESITATPDPVHSSDSVDVRVRLVEPVAPRVGYNSFVLEGNAPVELPADPRLRFAYNGQETTIRVGTSSVAANTSAAVRVGSTDVANPPTNVSATFTVTPPGVRYVAFRFWDNFGGKDYFGSLDLDAKAPAGGLAVPITLTVVSPAGAPLPASAPATITVPGGTTAGGLVVSTQPVNTHTQVEVKAGSGPNSAVRVIDIYPIPTLQSVTVTPDPVASPDSVDVRVRLKEPVGPRFGYNAFVLTGTGPVSVPTNTRARFAFGAAETTVRLGTDPVASPTQASVTVSDVTEPSTATASLTVTPAAPLPSVTTVGFGVPSVIGGRTVLATVTLSAAVPAGRTLSVNLSTTDPLLPLTSAVLTIPAGQFSGTVTVQTRTVSQTEQGTLVATVPGGAAVTGSLAVTAIPPALSTLTLNPAEVEGGQQATGTVTLKTPASAGGAVVNLTTNQPQAVTIPSTAFVPAGLQEANFTLITTTVGADIDAVISARLPTGRIDRQLRVLAPPPPRTTLSSLTLNPTQVDGGQPATGTVALTAPAPAGGTDVNLTTSQPQAVTIPATVHVPAGSLTANFTVATTAVSSDIDARIGAGLPTGQIIRTLRVLAAPPRVASVSIAPANVFGGGTVAVTVSLTAITSTAMTVPLSSNDPAIPVLTVQIPAGQSSGTVSVRTAAVGTQRNVRLGEVQGPVGTNIQVRPLPIDRVQFPGSIRAGNDLTIEVRMAQPAPAGGLRVPLASSSPAMVAVPQFVDVPAGATTATITVRVLSGTDEQVTITAGVSPGAATRTVRVR